MSGSAITGRVLACIAVLYMIFLFATIVRSSDVPHDFRVYYAAAQAVRDGRNPYDLEVIRSYTPFPDFPLTYAYPPATLQLASLLTNTDLATAHAVFFALKIICLLILLWLWKAFFLQESMNAWFVPFFCVGYSMALAKDFQAGNITIFEQTLIWSALACYLRERYRGFVCLIVLAGAAKLTPLVFLVLLFRLPARRHRPLLGGAAASVLGYGLLNYAYSSAWCREFWRVTLEHRERGLNNPCLFSVLQDVGLPFPHLFLGVLALSLAVLSFALWHPHRKAGNETDDRNLIFWLTLLQPLCLPRFKDYAYMLVVPAAFMIVRRISRDHSRIGGLFLYATVVLPTDALHPLSGILPHMHPYHAVFSSLVLFIAALPILPPRGVAPAPGSALDARF